MSYVALNRIIL